MIALPDRYKGLATYCLYPDGLRVRYMLEIDEFQILRYLSQNEALINSFDGFITKSRLQTTQDGKLVKEF